MEITGRLTKDATVQTLSDERKVVRFSIAINDSYKAKGNSEPTRVTTYVDCSFWINPGAAEWLRKGTLVQLYGRIGLNVYNNMEGKAVGTLTFHVNNIKVLVSAKQRENNYSTAETPATSPETVDDLPF